jgi:hypothetical protein
MPSGPTTQLGVGLFRDPKESPSQKTKLGASPFHDSKEIPSGREEEALSESFFMTLKKVKSADDKALSESLS